MKYDAKKLSSEEQALLRRIAVQRMFDGEVAGHVGRSYGIGDRTIYKWLKTAREQGMDGLAPIPRRGRSRTLSEIQEQEVKRWVLGSDPRQYGFDLGAALLKQRYSAIQSMG